MPEETEIVKRIDDVRAVVDDLDKTRAWQVLRADIELQRERLDATWQEIFDEDKLQKARVIKMAAAHILNLKKAYEEELVSLQHELETIRNPDKVVVKDYDTE